MSSRTRKAAKSCGAMPWLTSRSAALTNDPRFWGWPVSGDQDPEATHQEGWWITLTSNPHFPFLWFSEENLIIEMLLQHHVETENFLWLFIIIVKSDIVFTKGCFYANAFTDVNDIKCTQTVSSGGLNKCTYTLNSYKNNLMANVLVYTRK